MAKFIAEQDFNPWSEPHLFGGVYLAVKFRWEPWGSVSIKLSNEARLSGTK